MPLAHHLRELRTRVLLAVVGVLIGSVVGWVFYLPLFALLQGPVLDLADRRDTDVMINFAGVATSLDMQIKISLFAGVIASSPWWIYQLWAFAAPGLTRREKGYAAVFVGSAVPLFLAGAAVAWFVLPQAVAILTGFTPPGAANIIDAETYLSFVMRMVLAFGIAFLLPVMMVALTLVGLVPARTWLSGWRWAVLGVAVFAAMATPTGDAVTMLVLAVPMVALYFAAVGISALIGRSRRRHEEDA
jgi:sec-independent protein translocase protein TatC